MLLQLTRRRKVIKSTVIVSDGDGSEIGRIVQENMFGKIHFSLESGGHTLGAIKAENWRAWNFRIEDHTGHEVARITKTFEGIAKTMFTTADNYVVQIHAQLAAAAAHARRRLRPVRRHRAQAGLAGPRAEMPRDCASRRRLAPVAFRHGGRPAGARQRDGR